jgi:hypothetical protein
LAAACAAGQENAFTAGEIRIRSSYTDVVPEPACLALILLGLTMNEMLAALRIIDWKALRRSACEPVLRAGSLAAACSSGRRYASFDRAGEPPVGGRASAKLPPIIGAKIFDGVGGPTLITRSERMQWALAKIDPNRDLIRFASEDPTANVPA